MRPQNAVLELVTLPAADGYIANHAVIRGFLGGAAKLRFFLYHPPDTQPGGVWTNWALPSLARLDVVGDHANLWWGRDYKYGIQLLPAHPQFRAVCLLWARWAGDYPLVVEKLSLPTRSLRKEDLCATVPSTPVAAPASSASIGCL